MSMITIIALLFYSLSATTFAQETEQVHTKSINDSQPYGVSLTSWSNGEDVLYIVQEYYIEQGWIEVDRFITLEAARKSYFECVRRIEQLDNDYVHLKTYESYWRHLKWIIPQH